MTVAVVEVLNISESGWSTTTIHRGCLPTEHRRGSCGAVDEWGFVGEIDRAEVATSAGISGTRAGTSWVPVNSSARVPIGSSRSLQGGLREAELLESIGSKLLRVAFLRDFNGV